MKLKHIESGIQEICKIRDFDGRPCIELEQYSTPVRLAASLFVGIQEEIDGKVAIDLGCGCGVLSAGLGILGASSIFCIDIDPKCIRITQEQLKSEDFQAEFIQGNVSVMPTKRWADVVVTNPPFGTRNTGIDWVFVQKALELAPDVYSFHKSSTRKFFAKKTEEIGAQAEVIITVPFELPKMYKMHQKKKVDVEVDIWHFYRDL